MISGNQLLFDFGNNDTMPVNANLHEICDKVAEQNEPICSLERYIAEKFNEFAEKFFSKHADDLKDLKCASDEDDWWMELVAEDADLNSVGNGLYKDDVIRVGNAAAEWKFPGLVHACAYKLAEMTENMKLVELRDFLNEKYDFPDDIKKKIQDCPEFREL